MEPNSRRERTVLGWALGVSLAALLLDQWTKIVVERQFVLGESRPVWEAEGYAERYFALLLVLGGVVGNSIDRIWRGAVVDFFDFHWYDKFRWPVFNVADIAICIGVGLFVLSTLLRPSGKKEEPESGA